ncbi:F0F1 ATP synthase subunit B family protein [Micavibrio aeruginosavorus]|uniref:F0F1 ATP synthase subunit B family protein n=1 Tax=Micavibrio aeruginosavorus TaxID=349221 RepID=UPI003F4AB187
MQRTLLEKMIWMLGTAAMAFACAMMFGIQRVFAADVAHGAADAAAHGADHGGGGGLPQFDPSSFSSQIFWMLLTFAILYLIFARRVLPKISSVIENRNEHVAGDRNTAQRLTDEAEAVQAAYEASLNHARAEAARISTETETGIKSNFDAALNAAREKADREIAALDTRLNAGKQSAMDEMNTIAAEVAAAAAKKLVGIETNIDQAKTVVNKLAEAA